MTGQQFDMAKVGEHRRQLDSLETAQLIDLWNTASEESWTPEGLEAIRQLLTERLGNVPLRQDSPPASEESEEADTYHDPEKMLSLSLRLIWLSWLFLALAVLSGVAFLLLLVAVITGLGVIRVDLQEIAYRAASLMPFLTTFLISLSLAFLLRAVAEGLLLLMDIEDNTRAREPSS